MHEMAQKIIDLLRKEGMTIQWARLTLEQAIRELEFERLQPKSEVAAQSECAAGGAEC